MPETKSNAKHWMTVGEGQFIWGGSLLKGNGGAQRLACPGWKPGWTCMGISQPDCKADRPSRGESRAK